MDRRHRIDFDVVMRNAIGEIRAAAIRRPDAAAGKMVAAILEAQRIVNAVEQRVVHLDIVDGFRGIKSRPNAQAKATAGLFQIVDDDAVGIRRRLIFQSKEEAALGIRQRQKAGLNQLRIVENNSAAVLQPEHDREALRDKQIVGREISAVKIEGDAVQAQHGNDPRRRRAGRPDLVNRAGREIDHGAIDRVGIEPGRQRLECRRVIGDAVADSPEQFRRRGRRDKAKQLADFAFYRLVLATSRHTIGLKIAKNLRRGQRRHGLFSLFWKT
jgi:hypothetical protein